MRNMYEIEKLKSGFHVVTSRMPHMDSVSLGVWVGTGSRRETKKLCGISHLVEHMLFKGTMTRSAVALKEAIEGKGGSFNGFTTEEVTCYLVKLPSNYMELGFDVLSDMVLNPALDIKELEREKHVISEEIKMYRDQPAQHVFDILSEEMWPDDALGRPILGYEKTVRGFTREDIISYMENSYSPSNITCVACGKMNVRKLHRLANKTFGAQPQMAASFSRRHPGGVLKKGKNISVFHKKTEQTHVAFGFHSINRSHGMRYAVALLHVILGGNMSSRLFERLREQKGLCYDISSSVKKYKDTGAFVIHAGVANDKLFQASKEVVCELKDITKNRVKQDELDRAKEYAKGQLVLALEDTGSRMVWLGEKIMTEKSVPEIKEIIRNIDKVTVGDIQKIAKIVFNRKNLNFAAIGPAGKSAEREIKKILIL